MFKKLFKNKPIGFYFSLAASVLSLFLTIFYAAYMGKHDLFNAGVFVLYLFAFLMPLVYFFVKENDLTRIVPIMQTTFLGLAFGLIIVGVGDKLVYYLSGTYSLANTTASGGTLIFVLVMTLITTLISLIASFMKQTKPLTAEQQAEVDEDWSSFKTNTKAFAVKHKKPLIIGGAGMVALIVILVLLFAVIIPYAMIVRVKSVSFDQSDIVMYETETRKLTAVIDPIDAENQNISFTSSNENVATVTSAGLIKAVGVGETTITVLTEEGGYTAECTVEVKELTVAKTDIVEMPDTVHYVKGEEFDPNGISIVATLTNGKTEKINVRKHKLSYNVETVSAKTVPVTATYEYRGKTFNTTFDVYGDVALVNDETEFMEAYENVDEYGYLRCAKDMVFPGTLSIDHDIIIEGVISTDSISITNDSDVTVIGRVNDFTDSAEQPGASEEGFSIEGSGSVDIQTVFGSEQDDYQYGPMETDIAGIYVGNGLEIEGVDFTTTGIHVENGNMTISGGSEVNVLGPGYVMKNTYNGVDLYNGILTVDGEGTRFAILNAGTSYVNRAAIECRGIIVDNGAEFIVDKSENTNNHYGYVLYSASNSAEVTVRNGSTMKISAINLGQTSNQCLSGVSKLNILSGSTFEMNAVRYFNSTVSGKFDKDTDITINGVKFDMTQSVDKLKFAELEMTSISVKADVDSVYAEGDIFNGDGITLNAEFGTKESPSQLNIELESGFEIEQTELAGGWNTIKVKVLDDVIEYRIFAEFAEAGKAAAASADEFTAALANADIKCITVSEDLTFDSLNVDRTVWIEGNIKVGTLTVNEGATLYTTGRIWSDNDMTISGGGTVDATMYTPTGMSNRTEYAAIRTGGALTINGTAVDCSDLATGGDFTVGDGSKVTVYGKRAATNENYSGGDSVNGIHSPNKSIKVLGAGTELNILYNDPVYGKNPAAIEADTILVDGGSMYVGTTTGTSWGYAVWFTGSNKTITATNGAQITLDVMKPAGSVLNGSIYASEGTSVSGEKTSFTVITTTDKFQPDIIKEGEELVNWVDPTVSVEVTE